MSASFASSLPSWCRFALGTSALLWASVARAQAASSGPAELLFMEARSLQAAGRIQEACEKFAASQALEPAPGTLLNLGACYEALGRTATAWATYRQASAASLERGKPQWAAAADDRALKLEPSLPRLRIQVRAEKPGAPVQVLLDAKALPRGALDSSLPVDPGAHEVEARREGVAPFKASVRLEPGQHKDIVVDFAAGPALPQLSPREHNRSAIPAASWILGGAAVVSLGVGLTFLGLRESSASALQEQGCSGALSPEKFASCTDLRDLGKTRTIVEVIGFVGAGAFATASVLFAVLQSKPTTANTGAHAACAPTLGGLTCEGAF